MPVEVAEILDVTATVTLETGVSDDSDEATWVVIDASVSLRVQAARAVMEKLDLSSRKDTYCLLIGLMDLPTLRRYYCRQAAERVQTWSSGEKKRNVLVSPTGFPLVS